MARDGKESRPHVIYLLCAVYIIQYIFLMARFYCVNVYMKNVLFLLYLQVVYDNYYLYVFAPDNDCRLKWVRALKEGEQLFRSE